MKRVAINGFGRIGRLIFRLLEKEKDFEIVAINDLSSPRELAYLLKYDSSHGNYKINEISFDDNNILIGKNKVKIYNEKDPLNLPWGDLGIDLVFECTGLFTSLEKAQSHIKAGAKKVLISAPGKGDMKTVVYNVNHEIITGEEAVISAASCTTNALAPVLKVVDDTLGIVKGFMTTVHAETNDQAGLDVSHKKDINERRGRAASYNIVPTSTGAASAIGLVLPNLKGKLEGIAMRVPVITGSVIDLVLELKEKTSKEEINAILRNSVNETLNYTEDPIVSSDIIGASCASKVDGLLTDVLEVDGKQLVKIITWYDNEMSYSYQMIRTAKILFK